METEADDSELLRRYAGAGDQAAFAALVRRHVGLVYHAAWRQVGGDGHGAEEVSQRVFTLLAGKAAGLGQHTSLAGWLHTTARNVAREWVRAEWRRRRRETEAQAMQEIVTENADGAAWERLRPIIDDVIGELEEREREAVLLRFFAGLPFAAVGARLRVSENAARMRVERALEKVRGRLERRGVTSTSAALAVALGQHAGATVPAGLAGSIATAATAGALASAGSGVVGAGIFMSMAKAAGGVVVLAVVAGALSVAVREGRARVAAEAEVAEAGRDAARLMATREELERRLAAAERTSAKANARVKNEAPATVTGEAATTARARANKKEAGRAFLARHPEVKQAFLEWNAAVLNAQCVSLYRALNLTPAQIERFQTLMRGEQSLEFEQGEGGAITEALAFHVGSGLTKGAIDEALRELFGAAGYETYLEFQRIRGAREFATQVAGALCFTETPLTAGQANMLVAIIDRHRATDAAVRFDWDGIVAQARGVLSEPQMAVLSTMRAEDRYRELWRRRSDARTEGK